VTEMPEGMNLESELIAAFGRVIHQDHPNPGRTNCPAGAALRDLALQPERFQSTATLAHIRRCAPCLDELKRLRASIHNNNEGWCSLSMRKGKPGLTTCKIRSESRP